MGLGAVLYFEIWCWLRGEKWPMSWFGDFFFSFFFYRTYVFYHLFVICDWFSNIFPQMIVLFWIGPISQNHASQETAIKSRTQIVISLKVKGVWTWFWYQIEAESVFFTMIQKTYFAQNVTCSLFCGSASQRLTYIFQQPDF